MARTKNSTKIWIMRVVLYKLSTMNQSKWTLVSILIAIKNDYNIILLRNIEQARWIVENNKDNINIFVPII